MPSPSCWIVVEVLGLNAKWFLLWVVDFGFGVVSIGFVHH